MTFHRRRTNREQTALRQSSAASPSLLAQIAQSAMAFPDALAVAGASAAIVLVGWLSS